MDLTLQAEKDAAALSQLSANLQLQAGMQVEALHHTEERLQSALDAHASKANSHV